MDVSNHLVELTARFENVYQNVYCPYYDPYGKVYTRGYGETDWSGNFGGRCISHAQALSNLRSLLNRSYADAVRNLHVSLNQNQFDSLTDLCYNVGPGVLGWGIGQKLRNGEFGAAADQILEYRFAGGVELAGLRERREIERRLFLTPAGPPPLPSNPLNVFYPNERRVVNSYLKYRKHPNWHKHGLTVCHNKMVTFRKNIYDAAVYGRLQSGQHIKKGWSINNRYDRYQLLKKYTS
jgi:lysozyme